MSRDDFLIVGFTGAFASGCSEASKLFQTNISEELRKLVDRKGSINSSITSIYNKIEGERSKGKKEITVLRRELKKLLRTRSLLIAAQKTEPTNFLYISMTVIMYSLTLEWIVRDKKIKQIEPRYNELCKVISEWANSVDFDKRYVGKIKRILSNKNFSEWPLVQQYYAKIGELKDVISDHYVNNQLELFRLMQGVGNNLRKCGRPFDEDATFVDKKNIQILSIAACNFLKLHRKWQIQNNGIKKTFYVVECFRNTSEIEYFRSRFFEFYLFSLFCDEKTRHERAEKNYSLSLVECLIIDKQDQGSSDLDELYSQNIKKCVNLADISIKNTNTKFDLYERLVRYFILIKNPGCITPTRHERYMHLAYSLSLSSTCISRKVGAVIVKDEYVVGSGWNDTEINRIGCGYRTVGDLDETKNETLPISNSSDYAIFKEIINSSHKNKDHSFCYKDEYGKLKKHKLEALAQCCKNMLSGLNAGSLQQCRALHAEENAILQGARLGGVGLKEATIFSTTFPCELCAKKIMQVGINTVVYCEPYPKSVSLDVFFKEGFELINITPFEGVKSPSYFKLFKSPFDKKDRQKLDAMGLD